MCILFLKQLQVQQWHAKEKFPGACVRVCVCVRERNRGVFAATTERRNSSTEEGEAPAHWMRLT
eukprot:1159668-Pelagomonas_calceolata.AAC.10